MANLTSSSVTATFVGHPFNPIGTGRALRLNCSALQSVGAKIQIRDVYNRQQPDPGQIKTIVPHQTADFGPVNIFHLNGDEVVPAMSACDGLPDAYNIVVPFWELPRYPGEWATVLESFDEVWASSRFIEDAINKVVDKPVIHMSLPVEVKLERFRSRRYFGIPESSYAFLFAFDFRSFAGRKNPEAVIECFRRLVAARPWSRTVLVLKMHGHPPTGSLTEDLLATCEDMRDRLIVITDTLDETEQFNLIRCCDSFVSLHRSEGFGLGLAEAMYLGLPVIATNYSGNTDFMAPKNSKLVDYTLIPVPENAYPHWNDQSWADPDLDQAAGHMVSLLDDPAAGRTLGKIGSQSIRVGWSPRAAGLRMLDRLSNIGS